MHNRYVRLVIIASTVLLAASCSSESGADEQPSGNAPHVEVFKSGNPSDGVIPPLSVVRVEVAPGETVDCILMGDDNAVTTGRLARGGISCDWDHRHQTSADK